jgi:hypothetical protein
MSDNAVPEDNEIQTRDFSLILETCSAVSVCPEPNLFGGRQKVIYISNVRNSGSVRNSGPPEKIRHTDNARISHSKISKTERSRSEK